MKTQKIKNLLAMALVIAVSSGMVACGEKKDDKPLEVDNTNDKNKVDVSTDKEQEIFREDDIEEDKTEKTEKTESITGKYCSYVLSVYDESKNAKITNIDSFLNVRNEPSLSAEAVSRLNNNAEVKVIGITGDWYQVEVNGLKGFIHSNYTKVEGLPYNYVGDIVAPNNYTATGTTSNNTYYPKPSTGNNVINNSKPNTGANNTIKPSNPNKPSVPSTPEKPVEPSTPETVQNEAPVITGRDICFTYLNKEFKVEYLDLKATDKEDGDITDKIVVIKNDVDTSKRGIYEVVVEVTDSQGATSRATFKVDTTQAVEDTQGDNGSNGEDVVENTAPVITGKDLCYIFLNKEFKIEYLDLKAIDAEDGDITDKIVVIKNDVDTSKRGIYEVIVEVTDSQGATTRATFTVDTTQAVEDTQGDNGSNGEDVVENTPPVINVKNQQVTLKEGEEWSLDLHGVTAIDAEDGEIKEIKVNNTVDTSVVGTQFVEISVTDSNGETVKTTLTVIVNAKKNSVPVVTAQDIRINKGTKYDVASHRAQATDAEDGSLTNKITYKTNVDTTRVGTYETTFSVQDSAGATSSITVKVEVLPVNPTLNCVGNITINQNDTFDKSLLNATAKDANGIDITGSITYVGLNDVNTKVPGNYQVTVIATDADGLQTSKVVTIIVKEIIVENKEMSVFSSEFKKILTDEMNKLINEHRVANGVSALGISSSAEDCSTTKSKHMADNNYFDHVFNGQYIWEMYKEYSNIGIFAENIYQGSINVNKKFTEQETRALANRIITAWKNSPGHNANMLSSRADAYGFGFYITDTGILYATQIFIAY